MSINLHLSSAEAEQGAPDCPSYTCPKCHRGVMQCATNHGDGSKGVHFSLFDLDALDLISPKNLSQ